MKESNRLILNEALALFKLNILEVNINEIGNSANLIYELQNENNEYILRISKQAIDKLPKYEAEMDYINYLFNNQAKVSKVIPSINNKLVEVIYNNNEYYFVSIFEKAKGHLPEINDDKEWNETLFYQWGKTMGEIHRLTKDYSPNKDVSTRSHWNEDIYFKGEYAVTEEDSDVYSRWTEITKEINALPKGKDVYGLIHDDFHQYNFFLHNGNITVFDFDDCLYHWYICDIAIALYHALQTIHMHKVQERIKFGNKFFKSFLEGYSKENKIEEIWIEKIPLFLEYRRICSYSFASMLWKKEKLTEQQVEYVINMRYNIINKVPYVEIDFKKLIA